MFVVYKELKLNATCLYFIICS